MTRMDGGKNELRELDVFTSNMSKVLKFIGKAEETPKQNKLLILLKEIIKVPRAKIIGSLLVMFETHVKLASESDYDHEVLVEAGKTIRKNLDLMEESRKWNR